MPSPAKLPGPRLFRAEIQRRGVQAQQAAVEIGIAPSSISQILSGQRGVGLDTACDIHIWSNGRVPLLSWVPAKTRRGVRLASPTRAA